MNKPARRFIRALTLGLAAVGLGLALFFGGVPGDHEICLYAA